MPKRKAQAPPASSSSSSSSSSAASAAAASAAATTTAIAPPAPTDQLVGVLEEGAEQLTLLEVILSDFHEAQQDKVHEQLGLFVKSLQSIKKLSATPEVASLRVPREVLRRLDTEFSNPDLLLRERLLAVTDGIDKANRRSMTSAKLDQMLTPEQIQATAPISLLAEGGGAGGGGGAATT